MVAMDFKSPRADQVAAVVFFLLGMAMLVGGYTMDRLEIRQIHPASIPGLVPMILGAAMALCASFLYANARREISQHRRAVVAPAIASWGNLLFTVAYSVVYALLLVGTLPFWLATALYISVFVGHFTWKPGATTPGRIKSLGLAVGFAVLCAVSISALFRYGFLVRLP